MEEAMNERPAATEPAAEDARMAPAAAEETNAENNQDYKTDNTAETAAQEQTMTGMDENGQDEENGNTEEAEALPPHMNRLEARGRILSSGFDEMGRRALRVMFRGLSRAGNRVITFLRTDDDTARLHPREMVEIKGHMDGYSYRDVWREWHDGTNLWADEIKPAIPLMQSAFGANGFLFEDAYVRGYVRGAVTRRMDVYAANTGRKWTTLTVQINEKDKGRRTVCRLQYNDRMRVADLDPKPGDLIAAIVFVWMRERDEENARHPVVSMTLQADDMAVLKRGAYPGMVREIEVLGTPPAAAESPAPAADGTQTNSTGQAASGRRRRRRRNSSGAANQTDGQPVSNAPVVASVVEPESLSTVNDSTENNMQEQPVNEPSDASEMSESNTSASDDNEEAEFGDLD